MAWLIIPTKPIVPTAEAATTVAAGALIIANVTAVQVPVTSSHGACRNWRPFCVSTFCSRSRAATELSGSLVLFGVFGFDASTVVLSLLGSAVTVDAVPWAATAYPGLCLWLLVLFAAAFSGGEEACQFQRLSGICVSGALRGSAARWCEPESVMSMTAQGMSAMPANGAAVEAAMNDWAELLVARARINGVEPAGVDGLLTGLVRQVSQTGLAVGKADHLGYERRGSGISS